MSIMLDDRKKEANFPRVHDVLKGCIIRDAPHIITKNKTFPGTDICPRSSH